MSTLFACLLILSFLLQGVVTVYADDSGSQVTDVADDTSYEESALPASESEIIDTNFEESVVTDQLANDEDQAAAVPISVADESETTILELEGSQTDSVGANSLDESIQTEASTVDLNNEASSTESLGDTEVVTVIDAASDNTTGSDADSTEQSSTGIESEIFQEVVSNEITTDNLATSTLEIIDQQSSTTQPVHINFDDSEVKFNKQECTELASGSFYCLKAEEAGLEDALYAAPDVDGDLEIFLTRGGDRVQITNNTVDDASPFYDQNSNSLVWHKLINDRYQIISYDLEEGVERQLTNGSTNNMEPVRQGKYTVWQRWVGSSWDVVLHDGKTEQVLTESAAHDIAPYIHGSLVVWNRYTNAQEKTIEMYDIKSATYVSVNDPEGLSVSNPRMVFVYDSLHPNGDIVTKGFDMITKEFIALDTLPRSLPSELPPIDSTGETRALIQSKPSLKSEVEELVNGTTTPTVTPVLDPVDPLTLDLTMMASSTDSAVDNIVLDSDLTLDLSSDLVHDTVIEPDLYELVIEPLETP